VQKVKAVQAEEQGRRAGTAGRQAQIEPRVQSLIKVKVKIAIVKKNNKVILENAFSLVTEGILYIRQDYFLCETVFSKNSKNLN
jgi:hypothetical protein